MTTVFIAHPIGAPTAYGVATNVESVLAIINQIYETEQDVHPIAPYIAAVMALDENNPIHRNWGLSCNEDLLWQLCSSGIVSEVRLYGDRVTEGMQVEVAVARKCGVNVIGMTAETKLWLDATKYKYV